MRLDALLPGEARGQAVDLAALSLDSREVRAGGAFLACRGERHHGLDFLPQALARGATAVLWEPVADRPAPQLPPGVASVAVPDLARRAGDIAARFFGDPSAALRVVGITGTNGKTTCAWLVAQALEATGRPAAYIGTLGAGRRGTVQPGTHTTPDAVSLQRLLAQFRDAGATHVAMEVSSHALVQARAAAVRFAAAVLTNLSRDHLDFHGSMENYAAAKASLFERAEVSLRVVNADDDLGRRLLARYADAIAVSPSGAWRDEGTRPFLQAGDVAIDDGGLSFELQSSFGQRRVRVPLIGAFNLANALTVLGVLLGLDIDLDTAVDAIGRVDAPPGRMQRFGGGERAPLVAVDYAHTPDALEKALQALRVHAAGRLWCVFGCGGDRDRGKRPQMGAIAARFADEVVVTDDNPRSESPAAIVADILEGMGSHPVRVVHDRAAAIASAVLGAAPGDAVLVAGKGHESVQVVGREQRPFSDADAVRAALARRDA